MSNLCICGLVIKNRSSDLHCMYFILPSEVSPYSCIVTFIPLLSSFISVSISVALIIDSVCFCVFLSIIFATFVDFCIVFLIWLRKKPLILNFTLVFVVWRSLRVFAYACTCVSAGVYGPWFNREIIEHFLGVSSLLVPLWSRDLTQVITSVCKCLFLLNQLTGPRNFFLLLINYLEVKVITSAISVLSVDLSLPGVYSRSVVIVLAPENNQSQMFVTNPLLACCLVSMRWVPKEYGAYNSATRLR